MTWQQVKQAALQKMFAAPGGGIGTDPATKEDLAAMVPAANEAMLILCVAKPLVRSVTVEKAEDGLPARYDLPALAPDLASLSGRQVTREENGESRPVWDWQLAGERYLVLPAGAAGSYTVWYNAWPEPVTEATADSWQLPLAPDAAALVPLYLASQLCRDEAPALSATLRNEFEAGLSRLAAGLGRAGGEAFASESGWCRC